MKYDHTAQLVPVPFPDLSLAAYALFLLLQAAGVKRIQRKYRQLRLAGEKPDSLFLRVAVDHLADVDRLVKEAVL